MGIKNRNSCPIGTKMHIKPKKYIYIHNPKAQLDQKIDGCSSSKDDQWG